MNLRNKFFFLSGFTPSAEYQAVLTRATALGYTKPSIAVQVLQNSFITAISSVWSKLDVVRLFAMNETAGQNFSLLNMKAPSANLATISGTVAYSYGGWKANGTDGYIDNNFTPSSAGGNYSLNSAFEGVFVSKESSADAKSILTGHASGTGSYMTNQVGISQRLNSGGDLAVSVNMDYTGFKCLNRSGANDMQSYADLSKTDLTRTSFQMPTGSRLIFRQAASYGDAEVGAYFLGGSLTESEQNILRNAVNTYIKGIWELNYSDNTPINIYLLFGQSNAAGRGANASISPELGGLVGAQVFKLLPPPYTAIDATSNWQELNLGNNNTTENLGTQHGIEMRFGYAMNNISSNTYIIKYAIGGTAISTTWTNSIVLLHTITIDKALYNLRTVTRRPIVIRGAIFIQGESDCVGGLGAAYQASYLSTIQNILTRLNDAGYKTNKLRWMDFGVKNGGAAGYTAQDFADVVAAKQYLMTNFITDNPTYADKIKGLNYYDPSAIPLGDTQHYSTDGINTMGVAATDYFDGYVNE